MQAEEGVQVLREQSWVTFTYLYYKIIHYKAADDSDHSGQWISAMKGLVTRRPVPLLVQWLLPRITE